MVFAYADPPYPGCAKVHYRDDPSGIPAAEVDHAALIRELCGFEAWALSTHTPALRTLLPLCPDGTRVGAWVKPFASFKPNVRVAYAWEPVLFFGARKGTRQDITIRDWCAAMPPIFDRSNDDKTKGTKPGDFCVWLFNMMGLSQKDELVDLYPGSGAVTSAWRQWQEQGRLWW